VKARIFSACVAFVTSALALAADFYVSPTAGANGNGSLGNPWRLQTALNQPASVHPGDTIWLRGGTYAGAFTSYLNGSASAPITVRQYQGERATLDGAGESDSPLSVSGSYTTFWGFEVTNSSTSRPHIDFSRPNGVTIAQSGSHPQIRFINLIVHDTGSGFGFWTQAYDSEIYGCLVYFNGNTKLDHGVYGQNQDGFKKITDSMIFHNYGHGLHAYGSGNAFLDGFDVEGNTFFNNGLLSTGTAQRNLLIGGGSVAHGLLVKENSLYYQPGGPSTAFNLGYDAGCSDATVTANFQAGNTSFENCLPVSMTGNTFYGAIDGFNQTAYPNNTYTLVRPTGVDVSIRPNQYEPGRGHVTVYNWDLLNAVNVDLSSIVAVGSTFEIRNAANYFGAPVLTGVYAGGTVAVPMTGLSVASPFGFPAPPKTGPELNAFVVISALAPYEFFDVPLADPFHDAIHTIAANGITAGCAIGYFCPDDPVTRAQMAVFLLRSKHGAGYAPPPASGTVFSDVPANAFAASWIEREAAEGITAGCGNGKYCPNASASRAEMAVFLLKASLGSGYVPPPATGTVFSDVPANAFAAAWIEDLAAHGITSGCGNGKFCPNAPVTREEMAVFLVLSFGLS
jgi:hypothetical protein